MWFWVYYDLLAGGLCFPCSMVAAFVLAGMGVVGWGLGADSRLESWLAGRSAELTGSPSGSETKGSRPFPRAWADSGGSGDPITWALFVGDWSPESLQTLFCNKGG